MNIDERAKYAIQEMWNTSILPETDAKILSRHLREAVQAERERCVGVVMQERESRQIRSITSMSVFGKLKHWLASNLLYDVACELERPTSEETP